MRIGFRGSSRLISPFHFPMRADRKRDSTVHIKDQKILITGGRWTAERSRRIQKLFSKYNSEGVTSDIAVKRIAAEMNVSKGSVSVNLPYRSVGYKLKERSGDAKRCAKYRACNSKNQGAGDKSLAETLGDTDTKRYEGFFVVRWYRMFIQRDQRRLSCGELGYIQMNELGSESMYLVKALARALPPEQGI